MADIREQYRRFREWQQTPYQVAPLSAETHDCPTCGTHYEGNYCPRCGQSAKIGRYSFKKALLLFFDVWGLGNRGMFRSIRDLILRPGYMIRDYLSGMQMAYFPPFKMFFLLTTLSLLITHGMNIKGINMDAEKKQEFEQGMKQAEKEDAPLSLDDKKADAASHKASEWWKEKGDVYIDKIQSYQESYPNLFSLGLLTFFSGFFYLFFRKSPAIPGLRYSEFLVGLVYISNMLSIYSAVFDFFCIDNALQLLSWLAALIALRQLSGFGWGRVIWYVTASILSMLLVFLSVVVMFAIVLVLYFPSGTAA